MKRLLQYTVIPSALYVRRNADRQLEQVIEDMGRPGYILVARQMGKTNLLLNAKRGMESANRLFAYIDLSKPFEDERECFRHISDTICASDPSTLKVVQRTIQERRSAGSLAAYKEHEDELFAILRALAGALVVILDEIDSLLNVSFSDRIFAQIRSIYFSRVTFEEYKRLTYVLSGVVEPNDIIKNKNISPFNIGEKIYLDDFDYAEYQSFLERAGLNLPSSAAQRIFFWANGNPRITWDLCSEVEDIIERGIQITDALVDDAVARLYLSDFNRPPVDHIRSLIAEDSDIRRAVVKLKAGATDGLGDSQKNKLYLAGIIGSTSLQRPICVKNEIINESISAKWLDELELRIKGFLGAADEKYKSGEYAEALSLYEEFLQESEFPTSVRSLYFYQMGASAFQARKYEKALECFGKAHIEPAGRFYLQQKLSMGHCYQRLGRTEESIAAYREVIAADKRDISHGSALVNLGSLYIRMASEEEDAICMIQEGLKICDALAETSGEYVVNPMRCFAYFNLGTVYRSLGRLEQALHALGMAEHFAEAQSKPQVLLSLYAVHDRPEEKQRLIKEAVSIVLEQKLTLANSLSRDFLVLDADGFAALIAACSVYDKGDLLSLVDQATGSDVLGPNPSVVLYNVAIRSFGSKRFDEGSGLLQEALSGGGRVSLSANQRRTAYGLLSITAPDGAVAERYRKLYLPELEASLHAEPLSTFDFRIIGDSCRYNVVKREYEKIIAWTLVAHSGRSSIDGRLARNFALIYYYQMVAYLALSLKGNAVQAARGALELSGAISDADQAFVIIDNDDLSAIHRYALSIVDKPNSPVVVERKVSRNVRVTVRYKDGNMKYEVKYKSVERDIRTGLCEIIA